LFHYLTKVYRDGDPATAVSAVCYMTALNYCCFWLFIASLLLRSRWLAESCQVHTWRHTWV